MFYGSIRISSIKTDSQFAIFFFKMWDEMQSVDYSTLVGIPIFFIEWETVPFCKHDVPAWHSPSV